MTNNTTHTSANHFDVFRQDFPCFEQRRYMNIASRGILSRTTLSAIEKALNDQMYGRVNKKLWEEQSETARSNVAKLFGVFPSEIAFTKNVSDGLNIISNAIDWAAGSNMVCCLDYEHPNAAYTWLNLSRRGIEVRNIPMLNGKLDAASMLRAIDSDTRLVGISAVNFSNGARTDLAPLGEACRKHDALFLVDGAQSAGILEVDLRTNMVDAYAVSSNKGLLGLYGLGFLFCDQRWSDRLNPSYLSRFGILAEGFENSELGPDDYRLHPNAKRFDLGNGNYIALIGACASVNQLLALGAHQIEKHTVNLAAKLSAGFKAADYRVKSLEQERSSHIVSVEALGDNDDRIERLKQKLEANEIIFNVRHRAMRFGLHAYNNDSDVNSVIELAKQCVRR